LTQQLFGTNGTTSRPAVMPMDAYRADEQFVVQFDLPGVDPASIDLDVERNVLTVKAERTPIYGDDVELQVAERPRGVFSRQLFLGDTLDADRIEAHYDAGVLTLRLPIAEKAKPRKIEITGGSGPKVINA
jgi:HSP20 family protein